MSTFAEVIAPANEEGTQATILKWCKSIGESVAENEPLVELETDKVTVEISAPASGKLMEIFKQPDQEVTPGDVLGRISVGVATAEPLEDSAAGATPARATEAIQALSHRPDAKRLLSPSVRRLLAQHALTSEDIAGSGRNGRITAQDVTRHAEDGGSRGAAGRGGAAGAAQAYIAEAGAADADPPARADSPARPAADARLSADARPTADTRLAADARPAADARLAADARPAADAGTRVPHTPMRRRIAEHMARSLLQAPHVTTLFEADLTRVLAHRVRHAAAFEARGARLTLTAYFISACARALQAIPQVNATFHDDGLELHADANIGIGTALGDNGLIVPVIHRSQGLNLLGVARRLSTVVEAARAGRLTPEDVRGGTFTISNHGVGGSLLAAPIIINQPQVAILGIGKLQRRVCAVTVEGVESISVRSMCYLTLSIDHRALDAFQANAFLSFVVKTLEQWSGDET
jgi:2-oxoglutarate dehydrogenase E2 component (dihydrolipoamide succinyltransferase)